jgi:hypothetical protein
LDDQALSAGNHFSITWRIICSNSWNRRAHPATNLGRPVSALDGFFRTMVITIHKLHTGWFTFLGFLSESEILHLGGTPYRLHWYCLIRGFPIISDR